VIILEEMLRQLLEQVTNLTEGQKKIKKDMTLVVESIARVELKVDEIDKTVGGSQKDIMTILEKAATKDSVARLDTKIDLLNNNLFQAETDLAMLKLVK